MRRAMIAMSWGVARIRRIGRVRIGRVQRHVRRRRFYSRAMLRSRALAVGEVYWEATRK